MNDAFLSMLSIADTVTGYTAGFVWRAATGTVDPWTKNAKIAEEAQALAKAEGRATVTDDDYAQATDDVTLALVTANADPSQASIWSPGLQNVVKYVAPVVTVVLIYYAVKITRELTK